MGTKIKNTTIVTIDKNIKYLGINLSKHIQDLHTKGYTKLTKEIKVDLNKEIYHIHGLENL